MSAPETAVRPPVNPEPPAEILERLRRSGRLPRVRSLADAVAEIREEDPGTVVTVYMLRRAIKEGRLRAVRSGRALYVSTDAVRAWLEGETA